MPAIEQRPYVLLSCAMSVEGYIDDTSSLRVCTRDLRDFCGQGVSIDCLI
jgi:hypothetical protein